jgi:chaperonin GroEL
MELNYKEVIKGEDAKETMLDGIEELASAVLATMGPTGRTVIISDMYGNPYVTKDGVSVANAIKFANPVKNMAATLLKQVAQKTADEAGDGTTTSICLALGFIRLGLEKLAHETTTVDLQNTIDKIVEDSVKLLKKKSKTLALKDVNKVATISANNDKKIGKLIQDAYNYSTNVRVEEGTDNEDKIELIDGMVHDITYMSHYFVNNEKKKEVSYDNPSIIVVDGKVGDLKPFEYILIKCAKENTPVIFVVEDMTENILQQLLHAYNKKQLMVAVVKAPGFGVYRKDHLKDIATFTGAKVITKLGREQYYESVIGKANRIVINKLNTTISKHDDVDVSEVLKDLEIQRKEAKLNDYDREFITTRINNLTGNMAVISVGGSSEVEMKERKDRIDDAVLAVHSALAEGIVEGGGLALVRVYTDLINRKNNDLYKGMLEVLLTPSAQIYLNSDYKLNTDFTANRIKQDIIDPAKVTRCALQNAASVAKTILSTEAVVLNESQWN